MQSKIKCNLGKRPLDIYYNIFDKQGIEYKYEEGVLNLEVEGKLNGDEFIIPGNISSQFITGLMFTLPLLDTDSKIIISTELESKGYIDLTLSMLERFGIDIVNHNYKEFVIKGNQKYEPFDYDVEGDYSQGAFYLAASILKNDVILENMNGRLFIENKGLTVFNCGLKSTVIDGSSCPDIIPILTVVASVAEGQTKIINAGRLRIKECDRLNAITTELNKLGANIIELEDGLIINGVKSLKGGEVFSHDDHRIAMSLAIASTVCEEEIILENPACVSKSYPGFWKDFKSLGGEFNEWNMGE